MFPTQIAQQSPIDITAWLVGTPVTVLAFITVAWFRRWIVTGAELERCQGKLDAAEAELRRRADEDRETLRPALLRSLEVLGKTLERTDATPPPPHKGDRR